MIRPVPDLKSENDVRDFNREVWHALLKLQKVAPAIPDATDPATTMAAVNLLLAALRNTGTIKRS